MAKNREATQVPRHPRHPRVLASRTKTKISGGVATPLLCHHLSPNLSPWHPFTVHRVFHFPHPTILPSLAQDQARCRVASVATTHRYSRQSRLPVGSRLWLPMAFSNHLRYQLCGMSAATPLAQRRALPDSVAAFRATSRSPWTMANFQKNS
jgi:hypothetical protein